MAESKIKFVAHYNKYGHDIYDVIYKKRRLRTYWDYENVPKTVRAFMDGAKTWTQEDKFDGHTTIYE